MKFVKRVLAKIPKDSKQRGIIFATGDLAVALRVDDYSQVTYESLTDEQIGRMAILFKVGE